MKQISEGQISRLRWLSIVVLGCVFAADYGFDVFAKPVPNMVYYGLIAIAIGIDIAQLRNVLLEFLKTWAGAKREDNDSGTA